MDIIVAVIVIVAVLALEIAGAYFDLAFLRWLRLKEHHSASRVMVAFLCGFAVFMLISSKVPRFEQRIAVVIVCILLIYANLFLTLKREQK